MKLYIIRHGLTEYNVKHLIQGSSNIPLNEVGIKQAEELRNKMDMTNIDIVVCSPLLRTKQTAEILVGDNQIPVIYDHRLLERGFGILEGEPFDSYNRKLYWDVSLNYDNGEGVERVSDLMYRTKIFLEDLKQKYADKNIMIVSHGATIKALHFNIVGYENEDNLLTFSAQNCNLYEYEI